MNELNEKKEQIIKAAVKCFAQKGFHATSIQDIVDEIGIAKGSLYIYFRSKEELLISAFRHTLDQMMEQSNAVMRDAALSPRQRLYELLKVQLLSSTEHRDFLVMLMNESSIQLNDELKKTLIGVRVSVMRWLHAMLIELHGQEAAPYAMDGAAIVQSMVGFYTSHVIMDGARLDHEALISFMLERVDDVMEGMARKGHSPIFTDRTLDQFGAVWQQSGATAGAERYVQEIRQIADEAEPDRKRREAWFSYVLVLENELKKPEPTPAVVFSMLASLRGFGLRTAEEPINRLERLIRRRLPPQH